MSIREVAFVLVPLLGLACDGKEATLEPDRTPVLTSITVAPDSLYLTSTGQEAPLVAVAKDQFGNTMTGISFGWSSDNTPVATVSDAGVVRAGAESCLAIVTAGAAGRAGHHVRSNGVFVTVQLPSASARTTAPTLSGCARHG
jgi:hypothetical protein